MTMHFLTGAAAVGLTVLAAAAGFSAVPGDAAQGSAAPAEAPQSSSTPASPPGDAAAKHAKRTACLKTAKTKKLVGADKTSFLKACIAAP
jgi:hypothetical protein